MAIRVNVTSEIKCSSTLQFAVEIICNGRSDPANKIKKGTIKIGAEEMDRR